MENLSPYGVCQDQVLQHLRGVGFADLALVSPVLMLLKLSQTQSAFSIMFNPQAYISGGLGALC